MNTTVTEFTRLKSIQPVTRAGPGAIPAAGGGRSLLIRVAGRAASGVGPSGSLQFGAGHTYYRSSAPASGPQ